MNNENKSNNALTIALISLGVFLTLVLIIWYFAFGLKTINNFTKQVIEKTENIEDEWQDIKTNNDREKKDVHVEMPFGEKQDGKVLVYFFRGEGCPHCAEAEAWFESIKGEYGEKFKIIDYEVWNSNENAALMQRISDARGDDASGVPYIIIGDKSWIGYAEENNEEMLNQIITLSEKK